MHNNLSGENGLIEQTEIQSSTNKLIEQATQALDQIPENGTQNHGSKQEIDGVIKNALEVALPYLEQLTNIFPEDQNIANLFGRTKQYIKEFDLQGYANFTAHANETIAYLSQFLKKKFENAKNKKNY